MTFEEIYAAKRKEPRPLSPSAQFKRDIAKAVSTSEAVVQGWLQGTRRPSKVNQMKIAAILRVSAEELFPDQGEEEEPIDEPTKAKNQ